MVKLFEYKHFKIFLHFGYHLNAYFVLSYQQLTFQSNSCSYYWWRHEYYTAIQIP